MPVLSKGNLLPGQGVEEIDWDSGPGERGEFGFLRKEWRNLFGQSWTLGSHKIEDLVNSKIQRAGSGAPGVQHRAA